MTNRSKPAALLAIVLMAAIGGHAQVPADQPRTAAVPADQQPTAEQLNRLFDVMRIKEQMAATTKMMPQLMQQQFAQHLQQMERDHPEMASLTPEKQKASAEVMQKFMSQAMNLYTVDEMVGDMKVIYQKHLTGSDVENIITFYNSPTGQHMLDMIPAVMQEFMPAAMQKMQDKMRPLLVEMSKEMAEIARSPGPADKPSEAKPEPK